MSRCSSGWLLDHHSLGTALTPVSQTGGHGDSRAREDDGCCAPGGFGGLLVDGVPEATRAARDLMRKGADHIKVSRAFSSLPQERHTQSSCIPHNA